MASREPLISNAPPPQNSSSLHSSRPVLSALHTSGGFHGNRFRSTRRPQLTLARASVNSLQTRGRFRAAVRPQQSVSDSHPQSATFSPSPDNFRASRSDRASSSIQTAALGHTPPHRGWRGLSCASFWLRSGLDLLR